MYHACASVLVVILNARRFSICCAVSCHSLDHVIVKENLSVVFQILMVKYISIVIIDISEDCRSIPLLLHDLLVLVIAVFQHFSCRILYFAERSVRRKIIVFFQCISAFQNSGLISEEIIFIGILESIVGNRF